MTADQQGEKRIIISNKKKAHLIHDDESYLF